MEFVLHALASCREGLRLLADVEMALPASLFLIGLAGSATHCVGMCGPFVLGQVMADAEAAGSRGYGEWRRLSGAALLPYQLGRFTTYVLLGAVAGAIGGVFAATPAFGWLAGALLLLAAALVVAQFIGLVLPQAPFTGGLSRLAAPLIGARAPAARYALGVVLGFLPCGLLYGALAAAAGTASPARGALAMAAFAVGTMPALIAVGWLGAVVRRRLQGFVQWVAAPLLLANAVLMAALAIQRI